jgi:2-dehydro-3-deoxygluconokinase
VPLLRVVTFGEAMLRLSPPGRRRLEQAHSFEVWPAGAELNVAIGLARLGADAAWVSRLPAGPLGEVVLAHARSHGVDVSGVTHASDGRLGLYFAELCEPPVPARVVYDRAGSAFAGLDPGDLDWATLLAGAGALHASGIAAAVSDGCARAVADALAAAAGHTSYDLNVRTLLAPTETWRANLEAVADDVDTLLCSLDDARTVFELEGDPAAVAGALRDRLGIDRVVVSDRVPDGAGLRRRTAAVEAGAAYEAVSPAFRASEPIGAGDAFCAGLLHGLLTQGVERGLELGGAMAAAKQAIPGDAPIISPGELKLALAGDPRLLR